MTAPAPGALRVTGRDRNKQGRKLWITHMGAVNREGSGGEGRHQEGTLG